MDDLCILELYAERSEAAVRQTDEKYGRYCRRIAYDIMLIDGTYYAAVLRDESGYRSINE